MSQQAKKEFPVSNFPYLNKIWMKIATYLYSSFDAFDIGKTQPATLSLLSYVHILFLENCNMYLFLLFKPLCNFNLQKVDIVFQFW